MESSGTVIRQRQQQQGHQHEERQQNFEKKEGRPIRVATTDDSNKRDASGRDGL
jgi:hypothetical protein